MCGIVGYLGNVTPEQMLISKLKVLEYRGYDSAGIAVKKDKQIYITKASGEIKNLQNKIKPIDGARLGIAHTRWATHGKPTVENAHPHTSNNKKWVVVHNGIIENNQKLKEDLQNKSMYFYSETDTEVIPNLLEYCEKTYKQNKKIDIIINVCKMLEGSYALAILHSEENAIYFAKNKSPLYVAAYNGEFMLASDPICFVSFADKYYSMCDNEFGYFNDSGILKFYNIYGEKVHKNQTKLECKSLDISKTKDHFMLKEIYESKPTIDNIIKYYSQATALDKLSEIDFSLYNDIRIVGCGTAYNAGLMGEDFFMKILGVECKTCVASEFRYKNSKIGKKSIVIVISQSGETADTLAALELAKNKKALTFGIVNVEYSTIAKNVDYLFPTKAGTEIAVASTKAYIAQIVVLYILALKINSIKNNVNFNLDDVKELYNAIENDSEEEKKYKDIADVLNKKKDLFMIGRGNDYFTAMEACLKIKETSYINANAYYAGELKHGFLALIDKETYCVTFINDEKLLYKTISNAIEVKARRGKLILTTSLNIDKNILENFDYVIKVKKISSLLQVVLDIIPWQKIAYYMSVGLDINPDKPRNLAKAVTVE